MFQRLLLPEDPHALPSIHFEFEGRSLLAKPGDTVAAALLAAGIMSLRTTPVSQSPRGPWCMMGVCFECLVEIDGMPNCQACQVAVTEGMRVARQHGAREVAP